MLYLYIAKCARRLPVAPAMWPARQVFDSLHNSMRSASRPTYQCPEVDGMVMPFVEDDLRSEIVGGAADCPRVSGGYHLGQTKVN